MKLWLLERCENVGWDENIGFVIQAETLELARKAAARHHSDESPTAWLSPKYSTCKEIKLGGKTKIILRSFRAG